MCKSREWDEKKKPNEFSLFSLTSLHFAHLFRSTIGNEFDISFDLDLSLSYLFLVYTFRVSASINDPPPPFFFLLTWSRARARTRLEFVMLAFTCFVYQAPELKLIKKKSKNKGGGVIRCEVIELIFCFIYFFLRRSCSTSTLTPYMKQTLFSSRVYELHMKRCNRVNFFQH